jgi:hypothetical protein
MKLGLIAPAGESNPGTGRALKYSLDMAKRAILLDALLNAGIFATRAAAILDRCPDLSQGRATIKLAEGISIVIDGKRLCRPLVASNSNRACGVAMLHDSRLQR